MSHICIKLKWNRTALNHKFIGENGPTNNIVFLVPLTHTKRWNSRCRKMWIYFTTGDWTFLSFFEFFVVMRERERGRWKQSASHSEFCELSTRQSVTFEEIANKYQLFVFPIYILVHRYDCRLLPEHNMKKPIHSCKARNQIQLSWTQFEAAIVNK